MTIAGRLYGMDRAAMKDWYYRQIPGEGGSERHCRFREILVN
ncbi:MAG: hypothetical protein ABR534_16080 [Desulfotignum sp.]